MPGWARDRPGGVELEVRVRPSARRARVTCTPEALRVEVTAPPEDGRANAAVERLLAVSLGVRPRQVNVASGHTSRTKRVLVTGVDLAAVLAALDPGTAEG